MLRVCSPEELEFDNKKKKEDEDANKIITKAVGNETEKMERKKRLK